MLTLEVNMAGEKVREALALVESALSPESCAKVSAEAGADAVRENFVTLARARHRPGQRINYYLQAADSVIRETEGGTAVIRVPHTGIALRFHGGTVKPSGRTSQVTGRPIRRLAVGLKGTPGEGHVPADFADLFLTVRKGSKKGDDKGGAYLAVKSGEGVRYLFTLLQSVRQEADPSVLPADDALLDAAASAILDLYDAATEGLQ